MWEKINKEEKNVQFQRLQEPGGKALENVGTNANCLGRGTQNPFVQRLCIMSISLLVLLTVAMCVVWLALLPSVDHAQRSRLQTSAHVHMHTYRHLENLTAHLLHLQPDKVVSCYYNLPSESEVIQLLPSNIPPDLCTHLNIAFARIVGKQITLDNHQWKSIQNVVKLKQNNPSLKILLSVGGSSNDNGFSEMVVDHASRKIFIKSIKSILRNYTLDGIDLDWEFPALHKQDIGSRERQHFSQLLREIRREYLREKRNYILTIAAAAPEAIVNIAYDIDQVNQYVDYVNIMTYDYHFYSKYTPFTGLNAPLFPRSSEHMYLATLNINYTVHMYMDKGLERNKIVVGIPTYGHTFSLMNANNHVVGSPASGFGTLSSSGFINYPDVCNLLQNLSDINVVEDKEAKVPYLYRHNDWVSYDTPQSVVEKATFIRELGLRGAMIYSLNADDYAGACGAAAAQREFPLAESIRRTLSEP